MGERNTARAPRAKPLPTTQVLRWAVPVGTGYKHIVVDVAVTADGDGSQVVLRAFGKDKLWLLAFGSTRRLADKLWSAIARVSGANSRARHVRVSRQPKSRQALPSRGPLQSDS